MTSDAIFLYLFAIAALAWIIKINIAWPVSPVPNLTPANLPLPSFDYKGVIHCHTIYSDGAASFEELINDSNQIGLDFLVTTDHNTLKPREDGWEGWHGKTLVLVGEELSTNAGHLLVFNMDQKMPLTEAQAAIDYINTHGGISIIAHPANLKHPWTNWKIQHFSGIEVVNFDSVCRRKAIEIMGAFALIFFLFSPRYLGDVVINNTPYKELKLWDKLALTRKTIGIGGVDAHGLLKVGKKKYRYPSYLHTFQTVHTHFILAQKLSHNFIADKNAIYNAMAKGNAYFAFDLFAPANGFRFFAANGKDVAHMGDELTLLENKLATLTVILPPGQSEIIQIIRNGRIITTTIGSEVTIKIDAPGSYRVMVFRHQAKLPFNFIYRKKFWIGSNPITIHQ